MTKTIPSTMTEYVRSRTDHSPLGNREIADAIGIDSENLISIYRRGTTKVPPVRAIALANLFGDDVEKVLALSIAQYPDLLCLLPYLRPSDPSEN